MICYSVQLRDRIFVKGYGFLSLAENMGNAIGENISKNLSDKYSQKLFIMLNNLQQMSLKLLQTEQFKKTVEETCDLIGNKITKTSKNSQQKNSETVINQHDK